MLYILIGLLSSAVLVRSECPLSTPAVLWSTSKAGTSPDVLRSTPTLTTLLRDSKVVLAFYHPVLSVDQFSKRADVYNANPDTSSNQFDSLLRATQGYGIFASDTINSGEALIEAMMDEAERTKKQITRVTIDNAREAALNSNAEYVFIALPEIDDATFSPQQFGILVGEIGEKLNAAGAAHTVVYTGLSNGELCVARESEGLSRRKRQLSAEVIFVGNSSSPSYTYINFNDCLLVFSSLIQLGFSLTQSNGQMTYLDFPLPAINSNVSQYTYNSNYSYCNSNYSEANATALLVFNYDNIFSNTTNVTIQDLTVTMAFNQSGNQIYGNWYMTTLSLSFTLASQSNNTGFPSTLFNTPISNLTFTAADITTSSNIYAPVANSFHCTSAVLATDSAGTAVLGNITGSSAVAAVLQLNNFQVEPFVTNATGVIQFGAWNDCDMFFTIPILMAFFTLVLMLLILLFAFCVFSTVNTYDRFDDKNSVISLGVQDT